MSTITKPRRRWTDNAIESELRAQCAELGHFPTRAELAARGLRGLWDAMRSAGGVDVWRERLEREPSQPAPAVVAEVAPGDIAEIPPGEIAEVTHAEIAARAYELYEQGVRGDAIAHWHAAEQQLTSRSP